MPGPATGPDLSKSTVTSICTVGCANWEGIRSEAKPFTCTPAVTVIAGEREQGLTEGGSGR